MYQNGDEYYHKIDCRYLNDENKITGFSNYSFQPFRVDITEGGTQRKEYYWRHTEKACYYCIVGSNYSSQCGRDEFTGKLLVEKLSGAKKQAYYTTVAREKYRQYTTTNYFGEENKTP